MDRALAATGCGKKFSSASSWSAEDAARQVFLAASHWPSSHRIWPRLASLAASAVILPVRRRPILPGRGAVRLFARVAPWPGFLSPRVVTAPALYQASAGPV